MRVVDEKTWYQVKFEGYKKLSWEPEEHLDTCKDIIENFLIEEKVRRYKNSPHFLLWLYNRERLIRKNINSSSNITIKIWEYGDVVLDALRFTFQ